MVIFRRSVIPPFRHSAIPPFHRSSFRLLGSPRFTRHFFGRDIVSFSILPKLMFLSFIIFNYSTPRKVSSLKLKTKAHPHAAIRYAVARPSSLSMSICRSYCCLAWQISILQLHELNRKPSSCRVNHHIYELHVVEQKIRLSSTPLKPAEPTPRIAKDKNHTKQGRDRRNDLIRF